MHQNIYEKTYGVVKSIKDTNEYKELLELKQLIDTKLADKIKLFNSLKDKLDECKKYGKHHPDLIKVQNELSKAKASLFNEELVIKYKKLEATLEENLNDFLTNLCSRVSNKIKNSSITKDLSSFVKTKCK